MAATLINVCIPVAILWLATRRRFWSVRLLLALPVVAAILLTGYSALSSLILDRPQTTVPPWWGVLLGAVLLWMVGLPIVAYATAFVLSLVRVRWLKRLLALPVVAAILVAGYSALIFLIPERSPTDRASVVGDSPRCRHAFDERFADRGLRGRARFGPGPPAVAETGLLVAGALLAAILIGAIMLRLTCSMMPVIEHYNWSGWHQAASLGSLCGGRAGALGTAGAGQSPGSCRGWLAGAAP